MTEKRWQAECELVRKYFPAFETFECVRSGQRIYIGFQGEIVCRKNLFRICVLSPKDGYPLMEPRVRIRPTLDRGHLEADGALSIFGEWIPSRGSFAKLIATAIRYIWTFLNSV